MVEKTQQLHSNETANEFKEYKYSVKDIPEFTAFQIKIVMKSTNSALNKNKRFKRYCISSIMSKYLKVEGHDHLVRESSSHAIINADNTGYSIYMQSEREKQGDQIRNAVKEINTLKSELREIKGLIKELINGS